MKNNILLKYNLYKVQELLVNCFTFVIIYIITNANVEMFDT